MTTLTSLSIEIIHNILSYNDISFEDIINFKCVCKRFLKAATNDYFQKKKFFQRWPLAKKYYNEQYNKEFQQKVLEENDEQEHKKYLSFINTGKDCVRQLRNFIFKIMFVYGRLFKKNDILPDYEEFCLKEDLKNFCLGKNIIYIKYILNNMDRDTFYDKNRFSGMDSYLLIMDNKEEEIMFKTKHYMRMVFFIDEIKHLLAQPSRVGCDFTDRYYYIRLFDYLRIQWRKHVLKTFQEQSHKELLEQSATTLAQQLQLGKDVTYLNVKATLNAIALEARHFLKKKHPKHSIFSMPNKNLSNWENNEVDDNYWNEAEGTQIMDTLVEYMFGKLNFQPVQSRELDYICIDYVLENKHGNTIILYIIFESVARRLGLRCDIIIDQSICLFMQIDMYLFWIPRYTFTGDNTDYSSIIMNKEYEDIVKCFSLNHKKFPKCIKKINFPGFALRKTKFAEMLKNVLRKETQNCRRCEIFSGDISAVYERIERHVSKTRPKEAKFAVGMIVRHGDKSTDCSTGVIIGWYQNSKDNMAFHPMQDISIYEMSFKCRNLNPFKCRRICYFILTKSNYLCLVKEDDITLTKPNWIDNKNIYRYFCKFEGTHYVPNDMLAKVYPHDAAVTARKIFKS